MSRPLHRCEPGTFSRSDLSDLHYFGLLMETFGKSLVCGAARHVHFCSVNGLGDPHTARLPAGLAGKRSHYRDRDLFHQLALLTGASGNLVDPS